jgi:hypothetical protein
LEIIALQQLNLLSTNNRFQQFCCGQNGAVDGLAAHVDAVILQKTRTLTVDRHVLLELLSNHLDNNLIGKLTLWDDLERCGCDNHALIGFTVGTAFLTLDDLDEELRGHTAQFLTRLVADEWTFLATYIASALLGVTGNDDFTPLEMRRERITSTMRAPGSLGLNNWRERLLLRRKGSLCVNLWGANNYFIGQKLELILRKLVSFWPPSPQIEKCDLFFSDFEDDAYPLILSLQLLILAEETEIITIDIQNILPNIGR